jgi:integrase
VTLPWVGPGAREGETRTVRLVAYGARGGVLKRGDYNRAKWRPALGAAGLTPDGKRTGIHMLRHAYASYLIAEGLPITAVAGRMRHSLKETVETYGHRVEGERIDNEIASVFRDGMTTDAAAQG